MLENNRKRSRKSKLEVREGAELEEASFSFMEFPKDEKKEGENVLAAGPEIEKKYQPPSELQEPLQNVVISEPLSKMEFSVKIEVEECDEEPKSQKSSSPSKHKRRIIISTVNTASNSLHATKSKADSASNVFHATKSKDAIQPSSSVNRSPLNPQDEFKEYVTNRPMLLRIVTQLLKSNNYADKYLATMVRNYAGRVPDVRQVDLKQRLLQLVLEDWMVWYKCHSAVRDSPLLYKCYICGKSWWYLSELNDHIPEHLNPILKFQLSIELDNDECNLVCFQHDVAHIKVEYPDTNCHRCGRRADSHSFATKQPYKCTGCDTTFSTCSQLTMHEGVCLAYKNENFPNLTRTSGPTNCNICLLECYTETRLNQHLGTRHTVRSDVVTVWELTQCALCADYYVHPAFHTCVQKTNNYGCNFCGRSFQKKIYKEIHLENYNKPAECRICDKQLSAKCMEPSHIMLLHTDKFALMYKCIECATARYYQDEFSIVHHTKIVHKRAFVKKFKYLEMVILPKQSLEITKKYKVYKVDKQVDVPETENPPPINPPKDEPEDTAENMSTDDSMGVTIKEEPIDIYMDTSTSLTMADICVKTEKLDEESSIRISDITSLQDTVTVKQETLDEDVMVVEREADVVSVCSSEDGGRAEREKCIRPKKKL